MNGLRRSPQDSKAAYCRNIRRRYVGAIRSGYRSRIYRKQHRKCLQGGSGPAPDGLAKACATEAIFRQAAKEEPDFSLFTLGANGWRLAPFLRYSSRSETR